jgi:hypothetical protein
MADDAKNGARALSSDPASEVGMEMTKGEEKRELTKKGEGDGNSERTCPVFQLVEPWRELDPHLDPYGIGRNRTSRWRNIYHYLPPDGTGQIVTSQQHPSYTPLSVSYMASA